MDPLQRSCVTETLVCFPPLAPPRAAHTHQTNRVRLHGSDAHEGAVFTIPYFAVRICHALRPSVAAVAQLSSALSSSRTLPNRAATKMTAFPTSLPSMGCRLSCDTTST